jgi:Cd2+/Zn2+-exporting ATPase
LSADSSDQNPRALVSCRGKKYILFCDDGVDDATALAVADIGVSMGEVAAMAMEMSDVTLMDSSLTKLSYALLMGRRVVSTIKENILISLTAKTAVVIFIFTGKRTLLTEQLPPMWVSCWLLP